MRESMGRVLRKQQETVVFSCSALYDSFPWRSLYLMRATGGGEEDGIHHTAEQIANCFSFWKKKKKRRNRAVVGLIHKGE